MNLAYVLQMTRAPYYDPATEALIDPALAAERARQNARWPQGVAQISDATVFDLISYLPALADVLAPGGRIARDPADPSRLAVPIAADVYAEYLLRRDTSRRFLVESNNVYLSLQGGEGVALEPFKRAHRLLDVLKAQQELVALENKNACRATLLNDAAAFHPDIEKVIVVPGAATANAAAGAEAASASHLMVSAAGGGRSKPPVAPRRLWPGRTCRRLRPLRSRRPDSAATEYGGRAGRRR